MKASDLRVVTPCDQDWDAMHGQGGVRHCGSCAKDVVDLTDWTADQVQAFFARKPASVCGRLRVDSRGVPVFKKPVVRRMAVALPALALAACASSASFGGADGGADTGGEVSAAPVAWHVQPVYSPTARSQPRQIAAMSPRVAAQTVVFLRDGLVAAGRPMAASGEALWQAAVQRLQAAGVQAAVPVDQLVTVLQRWTQPATEADLEILANLLADSAGQVALQWAQYEIARDMVIAQAMVGAATTPPVPPHRPVAMSVAPEPDHVMVLGEMAAPRQDHVKMGKIKAPADDDDL